MLKPRFTISNLMTAGLTQIERARGFLEAAKLSEDWVEKMRSRALLLEAHYTTHSVEYGDAVRFLTCASYPPASSRPEIQEPYKLTESHLKDLRFSPLVLHRHLSTDAVEG
jgi:hypothetical protein